jgi:glycosyltransferase involved in cell wall biosynthesis
MSGPGTTVTVVVPVWDRYVDFLSDAVESVRRNAPQAPIVVVDNASSTPVPHLEGCEIVRSSERLSEGAARNLGLERVATEYVVFLDADDMLLDGALEFMSGRLAAESDLAVSASSILDGATGERHRNPRRFAIRLARWPRTFALANSVWSLLPIPGSAVLRTEQVRQAGGYADADLGEDWDLAVSLAWRGRVAISERLGRYYRSGAGSTVRRARSPAELRATARRVRDRIRTDSEVPAWARALLPLIAPLQLAVIHMGRPIYLGARRLLTHARTSVEFQLFP